MTSSAASETDRARKRTSWSVWRTASSTARPPPPGRCTSSRTTSGRVRRMRRRRPRRSRRPRRRSRTRRLARPAARTGRSGGRRPERPGSRCDWLLGSRSWTQVPRPGLETMATPPPWRWMRPRIESAMPRRSVGTASGSKPSPSSRTNPVSLVRLDLDVHRDQRRPRSAPRAAGGVEGRLLAGVDQRPGGVVERGVADHHDVDGHAPGAARPGSRSPPRPAAAGPRAAPGPGTARPAAPLLPAGQADDLGRGVGPLDQGQGVQHRVVQVGGHLGPGLGADAPRRSSASWLAIRVAQGPKIRPSSIRVMATPRQGVGGRGQVRAGVLANPRPRPLATSRPPTRIRIRPTRPVNRASMGLPERRGQRARSRSSLVGPDDRRAGRGQGDRPDDSVAEPQADLAQQQQAAQHHQTEGDGLLAAGRRMGRFLAWAGVRLGHEGERPGPAGRGGSRRRRRRPARRRRPGSAPGRRRAARRARRPRPAARVVAAADEDRRRRRAAADLGCRGSCPARRCLAGHGEDTRTGRPWGSTLSAPSADRGSPRVILDGGRPGGGAGCIPKVPQPSRGAAHVRASPEAPPGEQAPPPPIPPPTTEPLRRRGRRRPRPSPRRRRRRLLGRLRPRPRLGRRRGRPRPCRPGLGSGPPPGAVRQLRRRPDNWVIAGVASGIADYLGIQPHGWSASPSSSWSPSSVGSACWPT